MGGIYALVSMGLSMQYGVAKILNVSHGEFIMYGGFISWTLVSLVGIHPVIAIFLCCPIVLGVGYVLHRTLYERLKRISGAAEVFESNAMLLAFGTMFILQNVATRIWGPNPLNYQFMATPLQLGPTAFPANRVFVLCFAIVIAIGFYLFLLKTRLGKTIRATSQDPVAARLMGVKIKTIMAICFGIGAMLAGIAGSLLSIIQPVRTVMGMEYTLIAIIVVVLGGLGSIPGSFLGGFILGIVGTIVQRYEASLTTVVFYAIIMVLLLVRPKGLLGR